MRTWGVLFVLCGTIFMEGVDVALLNVALPAIRADLGLSTAMLSGVVSAYVLGFGGFILLGGRAADMLGRRRMFLTWLAIFVLFSGLGGLATEGWMLLLARFVTGLAAAFIAPAGLATEGWMLLLARFVTGLAAAFIAPAGLSLITANFAEGTMRNRALIIYGAVGGAGYSLGMVAGGVLTSFGWRWVFFAPVIFAALLLAAAIPLIRDNGERTRGRFDLAGAVTVTAAMLLLIYGVVRLEDPDLWAVPIFAAGFALVAGFVAIERRASYPLVRLGLLKTVSRTNVSATLFMASFSAFQFLVTLHLQEERGWSTLETGLIMATMGVDAILGPTVTPWLIRKYGTVRVILAGAVVGAAAYLLFLPTGIDRAALVMLPALLLVGVAFALAYGPYTIAATDGVAEREHGLAGGLLYTCVQFGMALGVSAATAVYATGSLQAALLIPVAGAVLAAALVGYQTQSRISGTSSPVSRV
ncbi:MFS transporter [Herbidospora cretacea]|uniref:MFS transporter n=1 Tax=Herbidospora cretacea TaxID=28444 RepID=UPI001FDFB0E6|nr:MFS transporter [Herbidospora cretacea]